MQLFPTKIRQYAAHSQPFSLNYQNVSQNPLVPYLFFFQTVNPEILSTATLFERIFFNTVFHPETMFRKEFAEFYINFTLWC